MARKISETRSAVAIAPATDLIIIHRPGQDELISKWVQDVLDLVESGAGLVSQDSAPVSPETGDPWWDTANDLLKIWNESEWLTIGPVTVDNASVTVRGIIEIATQSEVNAGSDSIRAITPATLKGRTDALVTDTDLDTTTPSNESTTVAPSRQSVAESIAAGSGSGGGGATQFTGLSDTPSTLTGQATKRIEVNNDEDGLIFVDRPSETPSPALFRSEEIGSENISIATALTIVATNIDIPPSVDTRWLLMNTGETNAYHEGSWQLVRVDAIEALPAYEAGTAINNSNTSHFLSFPDSIGASGDYYVGRNAANKITITTSNTNLDPTPFRVDKVEGLHTTEIGSNEEANVTTVRELVSTGITIPARVTRGMLLNLGLHGSSTSASRSGHWIPISLLDFLSLPAHQAGDTIIRGGSGNQPDFLILSDAAASGVTAYIGRTATNELLVTSTSTNVDFHGLSVREILSRFDQSPVFSGNVEPTAVNQLVEIDVTIPSDVDWGLVNFGKGAASGSKSGEWYLFKWEDLSDRNALSAGVFDTSTDYPNLLTFTDTVGISGVDAHIGRTSDNKLLVATSNANVDLEPLTILSVQAPTSDVYYALARDSDELKLLGSDGSTTAAMLDEGLPDPSSATDDQVLGISSGAWGIIDQSGSSNGATPTGNAEGTLLATSAALPTGTQATHDDNHIDVEWTKDDDAPDSVTISDDVIEFGERPDEVNGVIVKSSTGSSVFIPWGGSGAWGSASQATEYGAQSIAFSTTQRVIIKSGITVRRNDPQSFVGGWSLALAGSGTTIPSDTVLTVYFAVVRGSAGETGEGNGGLSEADATALIAPFARASNTANNQIGDGLIPSSIARDSELRTDAQVNTLIDTRIPANRRLPSGGSNTQVPVKQSDDSVAWRDQSGGLDESEVDGRINTIIPTDRRLPDPSGATDNQVLGIASEAWGIIDQSGSSSDGDDGTIPTGNVEGTHLATSSTLPTTSQSTHDDTHIDADWIKSDDAPDSVEIANDIIHFGNRPDDVNGVIVTASTGSSVFVPWGGSGAWGSASQATEYGAQSLALSDTQRIIIKSGVTVRRSIPQNFTSGWSLSLAGSDTSIPSNTTITVHFAVVRGAAGADGGGDGGGDGITSVASDSTLAGDGSTGNRLRVANPFTDDHELKLNNIESDAERNVGQEYTQTEKTKLAGIETSADANVGVEYTQSEKTKLSNIESNAKDDQSGSEIVSAINTQLGSEDWQEAGSDGGDTPSGSAEGDLIATSSTLTTFSQAADNDDNIAVTWTLEGDLPDDVSTAGEIIRLGDRPNDTIGIFVKSSTGNTVFIPWGGAGSWSSAVGGAEYSVQGLALSASQRILVKSGLTIVRTGTQNFIDGWQVSLAGANTGIPANTTITVHFAIVRGAAGESGEGNGGLSEADATALIAPFARASNPANNQIDDGLIPSGIARDNELRTDAQVNTLIDSRVVANPAGTDGEDLARLSVGGMNFNVSSSGGIFGTPVSWERAFNFANGVVYHTDITPPQSATWILVKPVLETSDGDKGIYYNILKTEWDSLGNAASDGTSISSTSITNYKLLPVVTLDATELTIMIGKTASGEIAVSQRGLSTNFNLRGIKVIYSMPESSGLESGISESDADDRYLELSDAGNLATRDSVGSAQIDNGSVGNSQLAQEVTNELTAQGEAFDTVSPLTTGLRFDRVDNNNPVTIAPANMRIAAGLGTAATRDTGTASGDVPELGTGGRLSTARLGSGTANNTKVLYGDGSWKDEPSGGDTWSAAMERDISWSGVDDNEAILTDLTVPTDAKMIYIAFRYTLGDNWGYSQLVDYAVWSTYTALASGDNITAVNSWSVAGVNATWRLAKGTNGVLAVATSNNATAGQFDKICVRWVT